MNTKRLKLMQKSIAPFAFAGGVAAALLPGLPASAASPASLPAAHTIQVHETSVSFDKDGKAVPGYTVVLRIARPNQIKALIRTPADRTHKAAVYQYADDGKTETEYQPVKNRYTLSPSGGGKSSSAFRSMSEVDLVLGSPHLPAPQDNARRTTATETLNGVPMLVTTDTFPAQAGPDGVSAVFSDKVWVIKRSGLLFRDMGFRTTRGKTVPTQKITFSDWVFNQPIAKPQIAFTPPSGAKLYVPPQLLAAGEPAPDFAAITPDGKSVHLSDYKGKIVVLDFWATWCGPCRRSMPHLEAVYQQVKGKNVAVLGVCVWDEKSAYSKWVTQNIGTKYNFSVAFDPAGRSKDSIAGSLYHVAGIPTQYIIDKNGNVAAAYSGYQDGDTRLEKALTMQGMAVQDVAAETKAP